LDNVPDDEYERIKYQFLLVAFIMFVVFNKLEEFIYGPKPEISTDEVIEHEI